MKIIENIHILSGWNKLRGGVYIESNQTKED